MQQIEKILGRPLLSHEKNYLLSADEYLRIKDSCKLKGMDFEDCLRIAHQYPITLEECHNVLAKFALRNCYRQALKICDMYGIGALMGMSGMMNEVEKNMPFYCWAESLNRFIGGTKGIY